MFVLCVIITEQFLDWLKRWWRGTTSFVRKDALPNGLFGFCVEDMELVHIECELEFAANLYF